MQSPFFEKFHFHDYAIVHVRDLPFNGIVSLARCNLRTRGGVGGRRLSTHVRVAHGGGEVAGKTDVTYS